MIFRILFLNKFPHKKFILNNNGNGKNTILQTAYFYLLYPKNLQFEIPESLVAGSFTIEVRNRAHGGKTLRTGKLDYTLQVA